MLRIDLNADLGEAGPNDAELFGIVSSCNIACGGHAGDDESMSCAVKMALEHGVAIGAHPSYPDKVGFGRRSRFVPGDELQVSLAQQIEYLQLIVASSDAVLAHIKPHGALYNDAACVQEIAVAVVRATKSAGSDLALVGPPKSALHSAAKDAGVPFIAEAFVDRAYQNNGQLVSRSVGGSVHDRVEAIVAQAVSLATTQTVLTLHGGSIEVAAETLCIHGDTPGAVEAAHAVRAALQHRGIEVRAICR
jgi:UPF0271 protein